MPRGRPGTLTPEIQQRICDAILGGNYREVAAKAANVSPRTFAHWCTRGRREKSGIYVDFLRAIQEAESAAEIRMVLVVRKASGKDAKHAEWWLERKFPERWGRDTREIADLKRRIAELEKSREGA